jgi:hypothetical protein
MDRKQYGQLRPAERLVRAKDDFAYLEWRGWERPRPEQDQPGFTVQAPRGDSTSHRE